MPFDQQKLETLVHYISWACDDPSKLGKVKLNKVLWYSEITALRELGSPLAGETYRKDKFGPVATHLSAVVRSLEDKGILRVQPSEYFEHRTWDFVSSSEPDMSGFTDRQVEIVADAIRFVCYENTASSISQKTHDRIWEIAQLGEPIPLDTALVSELGELTEADIAWAREALQDR